MKTNNTIKIISRRPAYYCEYITFEMINDTKIDNIKATYRTDWERITEIEVNYKSGNVKRYCWGDSEYLKEKMPKKVVKAVEELINMGY